MWLKEIGKFTTLPPCHCCAAEITIVSHVFPTPPLLGRHCLLLAGAGRTQPIRDLYPYDVEPARARSYRRFMGNKQGLNRDWQEPKQGVGPMLHKILSYRQAGSNIHVNCVDSPLLHGNWEGTMVPVPSLLWRNKQEGSRGPLSISRDWQSLFS